MGITLANDLQNHHRKPNQNLTNIIKLNLNICLSQVKKLKNNMRQNPAFLQLLLDYIMAMVMEDTSFIHIHKKSNIKSDLLNQYLESLATFLAQGMDIMETDIMETVIMDMDIMGVHMAIEMVIPIIAAITVTTITAREKLNPDLMGTIAIRTMGLEADMDTATLVKIPIKPKIKSDIVESWWNT